MLWIVNYIRREGQNFAFVVSQPQAHVSACFSFDRDDEHCIRTPSLYHGEERLSAAFLNLCSHPPFSVI